MYRQSICDRWLRRCVDRMFRAPLRSQPGFGDLARLRHGIEIVNLGIALSRRLVELWDRITTAACELKYERRAVRSERLFPAQTAFCEKYVRHLALRYGR
jgi:hypothetical protein